MQSTNNIPYPYNNWIHTLGYVRKNEWLVVLHNGRQYKFIAAYHPRRYEVYTSPDYTFIRNIYSEQQFNTIFQWL